jgi:hypothetical protein
LWKIYGVKSVDDLIVQAKYHCRAEQKDLWVATEGNWIFREPKIKVPYAKVTEQMVIDWVKSETTEDGKNMIEKRLEDQLAAMNEQANSSLPWAPQVYTPQFEE